MSKYYVVVLVPQHGGGWRAHFPDFAGCRAEGQRVEEAIGAAARAVSALIEGLEDQGTGIPEPRSLEAIRADEKWAAERSIDWSKCVVSLVPVPKPE